MQCIQDPSTVHLRYHNMLAVARQNLEIQGDVLETLLVAKGEASRFDPIKASILIASVDLRSQGTTRSFTAFERLREIEEQKSAARLLTRHGTPCPALGSSLPGHLLDSRTARFCTASGKIQDRPAAASNAPVEISNTTAAAAPPWKMGVPASGDHMQRAGDPTPKNYKQEASPNTHHTRTHSPFSLLPLGERT